MKLLPYILIPAFCLLSTAVDARVFGKVKEGDTWVYVETVIDGQAKGQSALRGVAIMLGGAGKPLVISHKKSIDQVAWDIGGTVDGKMCIVDPKGENALLPDSLCGGNLVAGFTWTTERADAVDSIRQSFRYVGDEEVTVPAGKFTVMIIEGERTEAPLNPAALGMYGKPRPIRKSKTTYWYARDIRSMVKVERVFVPPESSTTRRVIEVLHSYKLKE